ncbi:hypothetical protein VQ643_11630 [Pseudomonas sp. F1_0610]|uniref:hypothetical protein n=1 Tax=Pseudomonas sp. F1_0610 TaxID=3114284 RepID=UPI0039C1CA7F
MLEYANRLLSILDEETTGSIPEDDVFFGLFQCFMPDAEGIEAVFKPLKNGHLLQERILPIYTATSQRYKHLLAEGAVPGYFCPEAQRNIENKLTQLGQQHIAYLKDFALFCNAPEIAQQLDSVHQIEVITQPRKRAPKTDDLENELYELLTDWAMGQAFTDPRLALLQEAYYSIACHYPLAYYLQYPAFTDKPEQDFLRPYFELWLNGYSSCFSGGKLVIYC